MDKPMLRVFDIIMLIAIIYLATTQASYKQEIDDLKKELNAHNVDFGFVRENQTTMRNDISEICDTLKMPQCIFPHIGN